MAAGSVMSDDLYRGVSGALARAMGKANHAEALDSLARQRMENALVCSACGTANLRGLTRIALDHAGEATCRCGYRWLPQMVALGQGFGYKGRLRW